jgi:hypothetical protein
MSEGAANGLSAASVLSRRDVLWRDVQGEVVILDQDGGLILGLNGTGARVWGLLDGARPLADIAAELAAVHELPSSQIESDVLAFARELLERGLVEVIAAP